MTAHTTLEFTPAESAALDKENRRLRHEDAPRLHVDPALWAAFAEEREAPPKPPVRLPRPTHCITCQRPFRPYGTTIDEYPGTARYQGKGLCRTCVRAAARRELEPVG